MEHLLLTLASCSSSVAALALRHQRSVHQSDDTVDIPTVLSGNVQHAVFLTHFGVNEQQVLKRGTFGARPEAAPSSSTFKNVTFKIIDTVFGLAISRMAHSRFCTAPPSGLI